MIIIAIEGADKAGKATQSAKLVERLMKMGKNTVHSEFHRYDTPTGKLIQQWLYKKYDVDQHTIELIMAADKQAQQAWFKQLEDDGVEFLILDRYTASQRVYALQNGMDPDWINSLQKFMRQPDIEIYLDIPAEVSMERKGKHGENDRYESDRALLHNIRSGFSKHIESLGPRGIQIDALKSVEEIHEEIWSFVQSVI